MNKRPRIFKTPLCTRIVLWFQHSNAMSNRDRDTSTTELYRVVDIYDLCVFSTSSSVKPFNNRIICAVQWFDVVAFYFQWLFSWRNRKKNNLKIITAIIIIITIIQKSTERKECIALLEHCTHTHTHSLIRIYAHSWFVICWFLRHRRHIYFHDSSVVVATWFLSHSYKLHFHFIPPDMSYGLSLFPPLPLVHFPFTEMRSSLLILHLFMRFFCLIQEEKIILRMRTFWKSVHNTHVQCTNANGTEN